MNLDTIKVELIDWIAQTNDERAINKLVSLKNELNAQKDNSQTQKYMDPVSI